jgi:UDP-3-O-[3-hydroxymyristoyl] glucosamine N-acyltransferase
MTITARELADKLHGKIEGSGDKKISHPAKIEEAGKGAVSFIANPKYLPHLRTTKASALVVPEELKAERPDAITFIRVKDAYMAFTQLLQIFDMEVNNPSGVSDLAYVDPAARIGKDVGIGPFAVIGRGATIANGATIGSHVSIGPAVQVGEGTIIHDGVHVYRECVIGSNCILHAGCVIGSDGFGFAPQDDGTYQKIPQTGNVEVADDVEIGANTTIDRGTMGSTRIGKGAKIDNLVQIAHNVEIGDYTVVAAQAGISGSTKIGKHCQVGGQAGFVGHIKIADRVGVNAQSGVSKSVSKPGTKLTDTPAWEYRKALRAQAAYRQLPEILQRLYELEKLIISQTEDQKG